MEVLEKTKEEIQRKSERMSDFVKIDYLEACSKVLKDIDTAVYCYSELSKLYERNSMYTEAIKYLTKVEEFTRDTKEKINLYMKEIELFIKGGYYDKVEFPFKKAIRIASEMEVHEIRRKLVSLYKNEAVKFEKARKNAALERVYERLMFLTSDTERNEIRKKLVEVYKKLGKVRESIELEKRVF
jgi:tetratricopeptide (TPR) repeat protein